MLSAREKFVLVEGDFAKHEIHKSGQVEVCRSLCDFNSKIE
jgi:hypothetical protein